MTKTPCPSCGIDNDANARYCSGCGKQLPARATEIEHKPAQPTKKKAGGNVKQIIGSIVGICVFWLAYYGVQKVFFVPPSYDKALVASANEINKACPMMVDASTRLDNTVALPGNSFQYNYTILDVEKADVNMDTVKKYIEAGLIENVKNNPDLKIQREHKTTLIYNYKDKQGVPIYKLSVTPEMYSSK